MSDEPKEKPVNRVGVYVVAILLYLVLNGLVFETGITLLENTAKSDLFPMFPFKRIAFLILAILFARQYIAKRTAEPKQSSRALRYTKNIVLFLVFGFLAIGALASVAPYYDTEYKPIVIPELRKVERTEFVVPEFENE